VNNESLEGNLSSLDVEHSKYLNPLHADKNSFLAKYKDTVLYEVHLYTSAIGTDSSRINIPFKQFTRMDVYDLDKKHTKKSKVGSIVAGTLIPGALAIILAFVALSSLNFGGFNFHF